MSQPKSFYFSYKICFCFQPIDYIDMASLSTYKSFFYLMKILPYRKTALLSQRIKLSSKGFFRKCFATDFFFNIVAQLSKCAFWVDGCVLSHQVQVFQGLP